MFPRIPARMIPVCVPISRHKEYGRRARASRTSGSAGKASRSGDCCWWSCGARGPRRGGEEGGRRSTGRARWPKVGRGRGCGACSAGCRGACITGGRARIPRRRRACTPRCRAREPRGRACGWSGRASITTGYPHACCRCVRQATVECRAITNTCG
jgi:hypothetical protein